MSRIVIRLVHIAGYNLRVRLQIVVTFMGLVKLGPKNSCELVIYANLCSPKSTPCIALKSPIHLRLRPQK